MTYEIETGSGKLIMWVTIQRDLKHTFTFFRLWFSALSGNNMAISAQIIQILTAKKNCINEEKNIETIRGDSLSEKGLHSNLENSS